MSPGKALRAPRPQGVVPGGRVPGRAGISPVECSPLSWLLYVVCRRSWASIALRVCEGGGAAEPLAAEGGKASLQGYQLGTSVEHLFGVKNG